MENFSLVTALQCISLKTSFSSFALAQACIISCMHMISTRIFLSARM
jgi:hypothetical protein